MSDEDETQAADDAAQTTQGEVIALDGGAIENPAYERHKRGRNWAAVLTGPNAARKERRFLAARGATVDLTDVQPGQVVEFGGDYVTGRGRRVPDRRFFLVLAKDGSDEMTVEQHDTAAKALRAAREFAKAVPVPSASSIADAAVVL